MNSEATNLRSRLERFGDPRKTWRWQTGEVDYIARLAVTDADIPELVTIALEWAEPIDWPEYRAAVLKSVRV